MSSSGSRWKALWGQHHLPVLSVECPAHWGLALGQEILPKGIWVQSKTVQSKRAREVAFPERREKAAKMNVLFGGRGLLDFFFFFLTATS